MEATNIGQIKWEARMPTRTIDYGNGVEIEVDFSDKEIERRSKELLSRLLGIPPTFNFETGQPFEGPQFSDAELKQRGYL